MTTHHFSFDSKLPPALLRKITPTSDLGSVFTVTCFNIIHFTIKTIPYYKEFSNFETECSKVWTVRFFMV